MNVAPPRIFIPRKRTVRDLRTLGVAACVLALSGAVWVWMSRSAAERRENTLSSLPAFPTRGQEWRVRGSAVPASAPRPPDPPLTVETARSAKPDQMLSFVLKPTRKVALIHVNALLNTPLFDRIKECMPAEWRQFTEGAAGIGIDLERDVDRLATTPDGMAMSGFFDGKPIARNIARNWPELEEREYRGHTIWLSKYGGIAQVGNLLVGGSRDSMERLLDRALDPAPEGADPQDVYGDVFMRSDLSDVRGSGEQAGKPDAMGAILDGLSGVTVRANVWDMVAVSIEGKPQAGRSVTDLAAMARGAIALARDQLDPSEVELATLAELAKVSGSADVLNIDLALPVNDLFDKLHFPCPGAEVAGKKTSDEGRAVSRDRR